MCKNHAKIICSWPEDIGRGEQNITGRVNPFMLAIITRVSSFDLGHFP